MRGELESPDVRLATQQGAAAFAIGDRVQFTDTDKRLRIYNGNVGTRLMPMPRAPTETIRFMTPEELACLFAATQAKPRDRALFLLAYRHGQRASEVELLQRIR